MAITELLTTPYFSGVSSSTEVPGLFPVGLGGRSYLIDLKSGQFKRQSIQTLRPQADTGNNPGEQSVNPDDLWRRSQETWHKGAGQEYYDRPESDSARFRSSKGIDIWTKWRLALLNGTEQKRASTNTNLHMVSAGARLYIADGNSVYYTTDVSGATPTFTTVTGTPAAAVTGLASDGFTVYISYGASGVYTTNTGTAAAASYATGTTGVVRWVKNRVMVAGGSAIYNVTAAGALPAALATTTPSGFTWVDFAEVQGVIYAAGFAGDKSLIYGIVIKNDATALDAPVVRGELPDGEVIRSIQGYLGFLLLGTDYGVRLATPDGQGNLTIGQLLTTGRISVRTFEPQDRFVWFGWTNYDGTSTGLGRLDLSVFTAPLAPAFASDLMATGQGIVSSVATITHGGREQRVFAVNGLGFYGETTAKVSGGSIDSGQFTYGIPDEKVGMFFDVRTEPLAGTYEVLISIDSGPFFSLGTSATATGDGETFQIGQERGRRFELRTALTRDGTSTTLGPVVVRLTMRAYPAPNRGEVFTVPLLLHERIVVKSQTRVLDPLTELNAIRGMVMDHQLVSYQEGKSGHSVFVEDYEWTPEGQTLDGQFWNGTCVVRLKEVVA